MYGWGGFSRSRAWARAGACLVGLAVPGCGSGSSPAAPAGGGSSSVRQVANEGWSHVAEGSTTSYRSNPPASGSHYPVWARYEEFSSALARGYWVHNVEHGAVVFLYRPDAPRATIDALRDVFRAAPPDPQCGHPRALMTPDPLMPRPIAVVAADWLLESDVVERAAILDFVTARRNRAPENICDPGPRP